MEARTSVRSSGNSGTQSRPWADLPQDVLINIFGLLSVKQRLLQLPLVCKSWNLAHQDPLCWQKVELINREDIVGPRLPRFTLTASSRLLESLLQRRCQGCLRFLSLPLITDRETLFLLARCAPLLEKLDIPDSCADDEWATYAAPLMPRITELDLSSSTGRLSHVAVEAFGKSCQGIEKLCMNREEAAGGGPPDDSEALAIALHYPHLRHLELGRNRLSVGGLRAILENCAQLETLYASSCDGLRDLAADAVTSHLCWLRLKLSYLPSCDRNRDDIGPPPCDSDSD